MSEAAKQCRKWIQANYEGVRISRKACRDTAGGSVSQHSAYKSGEGSFDSNALDIFGPEELDYDDERAFVDEIVQQLEAHRDEWSIRLILWNVKDHYGHAHVDFWPTCLEHKWCGRAIRPQWRYSDGTIRRSVSPDPENGYYNGPEQEGELMPRELFEMWIDAAFNLDEEFQPAVGGADYFKSIINDPGHPDWVNFFEAWGRQVSKGA
jgi:hypothetical protein